MLSNGVIGGLESWQITEGIRGSLKHRIGRLGKVKRSTRMRIRMMLGERGGLGPGSD